MNENGAIARTSPIFHRYVMTLLFLSFYYLSYRYPFKINSSTTSPTYHDTPFLLAVAKYVFFLMVVATTIMRSFLSAGMAKRKLTEYFDFLVVLYVALLPLVASLLTGNEELFQTGIFFLAVLPLYLFDYRDAREEDLRRAITCFLFICIVAEVVQLFLFGVWGRLPALAYEESFSVRFGSVWDDPNGFSFFLSFLIAYCLYGVGGTWGKRLLLLSLSAMLMLTQSLTGIFSTILGLFFTSWIGAIASRNPRNYRIALFISFLGILASIGVTIFLYRDSLLKELVLLKTASIEEHFKIRKHLFKAEVIQFLGFSPHGLYGESGYINMVLNYGFFYLFAYMYICGKTMLRLVWLLSKRRIEKCIEIYFGFFCFLVAYCLGMFNLPLDTVFPLNLFLVIVFMITTMKIKNLGTDTARTG